MSATKISHRLIVLSSTRVILRNTRASGVASAGTQLAKGKANVKGAEQKLINAQKSRSAGAAAAASQGGSTVVKKIKNSVTEVDE